MWGGGGGGELVEHWKNSGGTSNYPPLWDGLYKLLWDMQHSKVAEKMRETGSSSKFYSLEIRSTHNYYSNKHTFTLTSKTLKMDHVMLQAYHFYVYPGM